MGVIVKSISRELIYAYSGDGIVDYAPGENYIIEFDIIADGEALASRMTIAANDDLNFKEAAKMVTDKIKGSL